MSIPNSKLTIEINNSLVWQRCLDSNQNPSGVKSDAAETLEQVAAVLRESLEQVEGGLSLQIADVVTDVGATAA